MNAIPEAAFQGHDRERELIRFLDGRSATKAYDLMPRIGLSWRDSSTKHTAFVSFLNVYLRARKILERHGMTIKRTNYGTPGDLYWIEHLAPPSN